MQKLIDNEPWVREVCDWNTRKTKDTREDFEKLLDSRKWTNLEEFRNQLWNAVKANKPCEDLTNLIKKIKNEIRQEKIDKIIKKKSVSGLVWENGEKIYTHNDVDIKTIRSKTILPNKFAIQIRLNKFVPNYSFFRLGLTINPIEYYNGHYRFLYGEFGFYLRSFFYRMHGTLTHHWKPIDQGDVFTFWGDDYQIGIKINGMDFTTTHRYGYTDFWLKLSLNGKGNEVEILS
jgi:hypothetical protein